MVAVFNYRKKNAVGKFNIEVDINGPMMDKVSLFNFWNSSIVPGMKDPVILEKAYYKIDVPMKNVPVVELNYQFRWIRLDSKMSSNRDELFVETELLILPRPLEVNEALKLANKMFVEHFPSENIRNYRLSGFDYSSCENASRFPIPVWAKISDDEEKPEILRWVPGLKYDLDIVLTSFGEFSEPTSENDTKMFSDSPFSFCRMTPQ